MIYLLGNQKFVSEQGVITFLIVCAQLKLSYKLSRAKFQ